MDVLHNGDIIVCIGDVSKRIELINSGIPIELTNQLLKGCEGMIFTSNYDNIHSEVLFPDINDEKKMWIVPKKMLEIKERVDDYYDRQRQGDSVNKDKRELLCS